MAATGVEDAFAEMLTSFVDELAHIFPENTSIALALAALRSPLVKPPVEGLSREFWTGVQPHIEKVFQKDDALITSGELVANKTLGVVAKDIASAWPVLPQPTKDAIWEYLHMLTGMAMGLHGIDPASRDAIFALSADAARQLGNALPDSLDKIVQDAFKKH